MRKTSVVILGGGPVGRAVWSAFKSLDQSTAPLVLEKGKPESTGTTRDYGAQFLWDALPYFDCEPLQVITVVDGWAATPELIRAYKQKVRRKGDERTWAEQFAYRRRAYRIKSWPQASILYNCRVSRVDLDKRYVHTEPTGRTFHWDVLINTLPLPVFLRMTSYENQCDNMFRWDPIKIWVWPQLPEHNQVFRERGINPSRDMLVRYVTHPSTPISRVTFRDGEVHLESLSSAPSSPALPPPSRILYPGKIWNASDGAMYGLKESLKQRQVYCVGRYGAWDQEQLLHMSFREAEQLCERLR